MSSLSRSGSLGRVSRAICRQSLGERSATSADSELEDTIGTLQRDRNPRLTARSLADPSRGWRRVLSRRRSLRSAACLGPPASRTRRGRTSATAGELKYPARVAGDVREPDMNHAGGIARVRLLDQLLSGAGRSLHYATVQVSGIVKLGKEREPDLVPGRHITPRPVVCAELAALEETKMADVVRRMVAALCGELFAPRGEWGPLRKNHIKGGDRAVMAFAPDAEMAREGSRSVYPLRPSAWMASPIAVAPRGWAERRTMRPYRSRRRRATSGELTAAARHIDDVEAAAGTGGALHWHAMRGADCRRARACGP